jgi:two-component system phosphate regulon sensor histidine kinase PhoR
MNYPVRQQRSSWLGELFSVARQKQTYLNILYLLISFPLGIFYFVALITGISVGISTAFIWIGLPILFVTVIMWRGFAAFERLLVIHQLHIDVLPMSYPDPTPKSWWQRFKAYLSNRVTWTSLIYLFLDFVFGIFAFTITTTLLALSLSFLLGWLAYLIDTAIYNAFGPYTSYEFFIKINGQIEPWAMTIFLLIMVVGIFLLIGSLHLLNGIAYAWGQFARIMLGMNNTELQLAEARAIATREHHKAERSEQSRRELIVNVSHELRTPIASIRGHIESLQMAAEQNPTPASAEQSTYLEIVQREADRLSALIDDLLALARAEAGELRLEVTTIQAGEVVEEIYQSLAPLARRERQITLVRNAPANLPPVQADRQRLMQVLLNLVRNAISYTPAGGIVSLMLEQADAGHIAITVADTGIGIPPEDLKRVFDRFYRTDASRARATGGFGLGLSIVRDLVNAMGGSISVTSTVGEGSQFRVLLRVTS